MVMLLCIPAAVRAQLETSHWFFGDHAGIDFTSGVPVTDGNGQILSREGTASFSDASGNLLFYTDGTKVYTRNHAEMPNGTGLHGHSSSSQSCIIIPGIGANIHLYYIFTTDALENFLTPPLGSQAKGLKYSVVDMALGTDGEVTVKNMALPLGNFQRCNEQLTAVAKADCSGYWVISAYLGKYYAFSVTEAGVDPNPVISTGGPNSILPGVGHIKASHDGKKIAYTSYSENGSVRVYDFNNESGALSNESILYAPARQNFGVEFSPDNTLLYVSASNNLFRYNLAAIPPSASEAVLATNSGIMGGALQMAPDGKIYYADTLSSFTNPDSDLTNIGVINFPDSLNDPGYVGDAFSLAGKEHRFGLPNFIPYLYHIKPFINGSDDAVEVCAGTPLDFSYCHVNRESTASTVLWSFGDGEVSTDEAPEHAYATAGTYTVTVSVTIGGRAYASHIDVTILPAPSAQSVQQSACVTAGQAHAFNLAQSNAQVYQGTENVTITFHATEDEARDDDAALAISHSTSVSKTLWIRIENADGCFSIRQIQLIVNVMPSISASPAGICMGNAATLQAATQPANTINWYASQNGTTPIFTGNNYQTPALNASTNYWVEAVSPEGCKSGRVQVAVTVSGPTIDAQNVSVCSGNSVTLTASSPGNVINWYSSATSANPIATGAAFTTPALISGTSYWVEAEAAAGCLSGRVEVTVTVHPVPAITVGNAAILCSGMATTLTASTTAGNTIRWYTSAAAASPIAATASFTTPALTSTTSYWVEAISPEGCTSARVQVPVMVNGTPVLTIPATNVGICEGATIALSVLSAGNTVNWYDSDVSTVPLHTGMTFTTPVLTATTGYWVEGVSPDGCISGRVEIRVTVTSWTTPAFVLQQEYCQDEQPELLPALSYNGIYGTWSPRQINTAIPGIWDYVFTPNPGQCTSGPETVQVEVHPTVTPQFNLVTQYFFEEMQQVLPNVSDNGVTGTWVEADVVGGSLPGIKKYTFTPDEGQCAEDFSVAIKVIDYPKFFTPNGDGVNEMWNIWGFTAENKAEILIFDRYGKLVMQLNPLRQAWDGTYNGNKLFSTDYWFTVTFVINGEHREFKSHFSLLR